MSHSKFYSRTSSLIYDLESGSKFFNAGVGVWSPKFSNSGVGVPQKNKDSASLTKTHKSRMTYQRHSCVHRCAME